MGKTEQYQVAKPLDSAEDKTFYIAPQLVTRLQNTKKFNKSTISELILYGIKYYPEFINYEH